MKQLTKHSMWHFLLSSFGRAGGGLILCVLFFSSCDLSDTRDQLASISYTSFSVSVVYADTTYIFTYNDDTVQYASSYYVPLQILRKDSVGVFRAYRGISMELDTILHINPNDEFSFIQFPGEKIKFYDADAGESEPAPTDSTCTKIRFTYNADYNTADSLRFIWISSKKASLSLPGATAENFDTLMLYKNKLSHYVEFDTDKYKSAGSNTYFFYTCQTWNGSTWTGSTKTAMTNTAITGATYKFATFQFESEFKFLFGITWK